MFKQKLIIQQNQFKKTKSKIVKKYTKFNILEQNQINSWINFISLRLVRVHKLLRYNKKKKKDVSIRIRTISSSINI